MCGHGIEPISKGAPLGVRPVGTPVQPNLRRSERIHVRMPLSLCVRSDPPGVKRAASTIDLSDQGVRVSPSGGLIQGQDVKVEILMDAPSGYPIRGQVAWVGQIGSSLEGHAGIKFVNPLPAPA